jgi:hypothetical protein
VIGAVIDLGNCLDLVSRDDIELLRAAYASFKSVQMKAGLPMPKNRNPRGSKNKDRLLRYLDCAVFRHLHQIMADLRDDYPEIKPGADIDSQKRLFLSDG